MAGPRDVKAGRAYIELGTNQGPFNKGLKRAQAKLRAFGRSVGAIGATFAKLGGLIVAPLALTVKAASDLEETMNKFGVVFGEQAKAMQAWGDAFAAQVGRSKAQVRSFLAEAQDLFVPIGFDAGAATKMSKTVSRLAVDLASFNNMADADVMRDLKAALTGSGEVMKKYGVIVSEAAVKQKLLAQGLDVTKATDTDKVMARLSIILAGTTAAQGDAIRSSGSFANQMKRLRANVADASATIGSALLPILTKFTPKLTETVRGVAEWIEGNRELIAVALKVGAGLLAAGVAMLVVGKVAAIAATALGVLGTVFAAVLSPVGLLVTAIVAAGAALLVMGQKGETLGAKLRNALIGAFAAVSFAIERWRDILKYAFLAAAYGLVRFAGQTKHFLTKVVPAYLTWFRDNWKEIFVTIWRGTKAVVTNIWTNLVNLWKAIKGLFAGEGFQFEWTGLLDGFESAVKELPKIAAREIGPLEKGLEEQMDRLGRDLGRDFAKYRKKWAVKLAPFIGGPAAAEEGPKAIGDKAAAAFKDVADQLKHQPDAAAKITAKGGFVAANLLGFQAGGATDRMADGISQIALNTRRLRDADEISFS